MEALLLLGSAVLGAIVGGAVTYRGMNAIESQKLQRLRTGALRATLGEMQANAGAALSFLTVGPDALASFSSETWRKANLELAQFLPHEMYHRLVLVYHLLPATRVHARTMGLSVHSQDQLKSFVDQNKRVMDALLTLPEAKSFRVDWQHMPPGPLFAHREEDISG